MWICLFRLTYEGREPEDYFDRYVWPAFIECYSELREQDNVGQYGYVPEDLSECTA